MYLLVFLINTVFSYEIICDTLLRYVRVQRHAAINLPGFSVSFSKTLFVLWMAFINGRGINVLIVVRLQPEKPLVLCKLVPRPPCCRGLCSCRLQGVIAVCWSIRYPSLEGALAIIPVARNCRVSTECAGIACGRLVHQIDREQVFHKPFCGLPSSFAVTPPRLSPASFR